ncbi:MAG TPA: hypothetical protein ENN06_11310 [Desulfobacteraceae bacterium]|nr:hypothetical protein [Desulfobacteraceae bacterium]
MIFSLSHISRAAIFFLILLLPGCATQPGSGSGPPRHPPVSTPETSTQRDGSREPSETGHEAPERDGRREPSVSREAPQRDERRETVVIGGETYSVPPPWLGNRVVAPRFDSSDFRRVPVEYTHNEGKVYVLALAHGPLVDLLRAADEDGIRLEVDSGYRSERYQKRIFRRMLAEGRSFDDIARYVAPPGYSQHMLGTAVDFFPSDWRFADTAAYAWLRENARRFGFEETYAPDSSAKFPWEAWHWNFTGQKGKDQTFSVLFPTSTKKGRGAGRQE